MKSKAIAHPRAHYGNHLKCEPKTSSFFGTQPRSTQVPPAPPNVSVAFVEYGISQIWDEERKRT